MIAAYPPGPRGSLLLGSADAFRRDRLGFLRQCAAYGDVAHFRLINRHAYLFTHPDLIHAVLVDQHDAFHKSRLLKENTRQSIGEGSLVIEGEAWKQRRKLIQPAFHHKRIESYAATFVQHTRRMLDAWPVGETRDVAPEMTRLTLGIAAKTLFNAELSDTADELGTAITVGLNNLSSRLSRPLLARLGWLPRNRAAMAQAAKLDAVINGLIAQRRASNEDTGDVMSMLLAARDEEGHTLTDKQIHDEALTLFIAGHETTANALTWALYLLAQHPDAEARLIDEVRGVLGARAATAADLAQMPYTEQVIKETMRLYPPAWIVPRVAIREVQIGAARLRPGDAAMTSPYITHRDPRWYADPERFAPERFTPEGEKALPRYAYFPFGGGPRICVGNQFAMMEARLVLATLYQQRRLALLPDQTITPNPLITLRPNGAILMRGVI
jgi:cytochrome P450